SWRRWGPILPARTDDAAARPKRVRPSRHCGCAQCETMYPVSSRGSCCLGFVQRQNTECGIEDQPLAVGQLVEYGEVIALRTNDLSRMNAGPALRDYRRLLVKALIFIASYGRQKPRARMRIEQGRARLHGGIARHPAYSRHRRYIEQGDEVVQSA